ncbi:Retrotransposon protein [Abeliophyllum distichum]|uniref:Retrotransposon protein n=1 Tax=Abeliophyllum distichum TaxID=126358 RepID=A0ABD1QEP5_9LAMI
MPKAPTEEATPENVQAYNTHSDDNNFATYDACNMSHELEKMHEYETSKIGVMVKGSLVRAHVLKTIDYIDKLNQLSFTMDYKLSVDLVMQSLPNSFLHFIVNFNTNKIQYTLLKLLNMLKTVEPKGMGKLWPLTPLGSLRENLKGLFRKDLRKPNLLENI